MSTLNWELHQQLKAEGRLNLLFRLSEPCASWLQNTSARQSPRKVIPFISRAMHLEWRERWKRGRFVRLSWTNEERAAILRQDELFREADRQWERRHPKPVTPAVVSAFPSSPNSGFAREAPSSDLWTARCMASYECDCQDAGRLGMVSISCVCEDFQDG